VGIVTEALAAADESRPRPSRPARLRVVQLLRICTDLSVRFPAVSARDVSESASDVSGQV